MRHSQSQSQSDKETVSNGGRSLYCSVPQPPVLVGSQAGRFRLMERWLTGTAGFIKTLFGEIERIELWS